ncbi:hypothetical protein BJ508DRAFT_326431 [Ascobolus immersus RN42]|uniref:Uncharacterized protein n=1 Tax=Ascobolus immersus RN42 TaxID=1160509 RepID=A0A3N4IAY2_ASCIM|nr:hypothetical protein BJ508DRAFT_326431 [Ascobolus immersus RN42]
MPPFGGSSQKRSLTPWKNETEFYAKGKKRRRVPDPNPNHDNRESVAGDEPNHLFASTTTLAVPLNTARRSSTAATTNPPVGGTLQPVGPLEHNQRHTTTQQSRRPHPRPSSSSLSPFERYLRESNTANPSEVEAYTVIDNIAKQQQHARAVGVDFGGSSGHQSNVNPPVGLRPFATGLAGAAPVPENFVYRGQYSVPDDTQSRQHQSNEIDFDLDEETYNEEAGGEGTDGIMADMSVYDINDDAETGVHTVTEMEEAIKSANDKEPEASGVGPASPEVTTNTESAPSQHPNSLVDKETPRSSEIVQGVQPQEPEIRRDEEGRAPCSDKTQGIPKTLHDPDPQADKDHTDASTTQQTQSNDASNPDGPAAPVIPPPTPPTPPTPPQNPWDPTDLAKYGLVNGKCCETHKLNDDGSVLVSPDCLTRISSFAWKTKHGISDAALSDLWEMEKQFWWNPGHLPKSPTTLKKMREQLPSLEIHEETVKVEIEKGDSKATSTATQYTFSIRDIVERSLNNPQVFDQCHFGAGVENSTNTEAHDGLVWKGSVLTSLDIHPNKTTAEETPSHIYPGGCYEVECVDTSDNVWNILVRAISVFKKSKDSDETWSDVQPIIRNYAELILFGLTHRAELFEFGTVEVPTGAPETPTDESTGEGEAPSNPNPTSTPPPIHRATVGYLLKREYKICTSRFKRAVCVEIDRRDDDLDDVLPRMKILRKGGVLPTNKDIREGKVDEEGASTRKRRKANTKNTRGRKVTTTTRGTRRTNRTATVQDDPDEDYIDNDDERDNERNEDETNGDAEDGFDRDVSAEATKAILEETEKLMQGNTRSLTGSKMNDGLPACIVRSLIVPENKSKFDLNMFRRALPVAKAHAQVLRSDSRRAISQTQIEREIARLGILTNTPMSIVRPKSHVVLERLVSAGHLRKTTAELELEKGEVCLDELEKTKDSVPRLGVVIDLYSDKAVFARSMHVDLESFTRDDYMAMEIAVLESRRLLDELYRPFDKKEPKLRFSKTGKPFFVNARGGTVRGRPNYHNGGHMRSNALYFGTNLITSCSIGELVHKLWKQLVPHTNFYEMDREFCRFWATMDALRFMVDTAMDHPWTPKLMFLKWMVPTLFTGYFFGHIARQSEEGKWITNSSGRASRIPIMKEARFPDIFFGAPIPFTVAKDHIKYPVVLKNRAENDTFIQALRNAYLSYGLSGTQLDLTKSIAVYLPDGRKINNLPPLQWWESVSYYDTISECRSRIRLEDFITVHEKARRNLKISNNGVGNQGFKEQFAKVIGICTHFQRGVHYVFLYIQWLHTESKHIDREMRGLEIYDLEPLPRPGTNSRWTNLIGLPSISDSKPPFFVPFNKKSRDTNSRATTNSDLNDTSEINYEDGREGNDTTLESTRFTVRSASKAKESYYLNTWFFESV